MVGDALLWRALAGVVVAAVGDGSAPHSLPAVQVRQLSFHEGLAAARIGDKYGYVDEFGRVVIAPRFDYANVFSEGLARVVIGGRSGYIDHSGTMVIPPRFHKAHRFSEGMARVCAPPRNPSLLTRLVGWLGWEDVEGYPCGYIDRHGELVIDYLYVPAGGFQGGVARVRTLDGVDGYVDRNGRFRPSPP